ncbi:MAG: hypothetical protein O6943_12460 [Bacteroidetes bacterium]|nr:hypothetical protein [Bacteroidota bacterium]
MNKLVIVVYFLILVCVSVEGQNGSKSDFMRNDPNVPDSESVFVHHNATLFFTGEYLFYKVYSINSTKHTLSKLSKIAYVELVSEHRKSVFKHKIAINNSQGQGDFFIPNSVSSGNYKLIAYTQRMKNIGASSFFQADISIINPYRGNQSSIVDSEMNESAISEITTSENNARAITKEEDSYSEFKLLVAEQKFKKRTEVNVTFKNFIKERGFGHYSLSVRKMDAIPNFPKDNSVDFDTRIRGNDNKTNKDMPGNIKYPSESKGSIISGKVFRKDTNVPANDQNVAISISGQYFFFKVATTNKRGAFSFSLDTFYQSDIATLQVVGDTREDYKIELNSPAPIAYDEISFASFTITPSLESAIVERSINNQIENAYFSIKPDTLRSKLPEKPFMFYEKKLRYDLDDYTRFGTMEEVFREIVKLVWTITDANGKLKIRVFENKFSTPTQNPPLLFIDGVFVQDPDDLLTYNARKVKNITVVRNKYQFGSKDYQGVILIETIAGDYKNQQSGDFVEDLTLFKPEPRKKYYQQKYEKPTESTTRRIPDVRTQLFWEPDIDLSDGEINFKFYTSDNPGDYEISLEGFTREGRPVSLRKVITVVD